MNPDPQTTISASLLRDTLGVPEGGRPVYREDTAETDVQDWPTDQDWPTEIDERDGPALALFVCGLAFFTVGAFGTGGGLHWPQGLGEWACAGVGWLSLSASVLAWLVPRAAQWWCFRWLVGTGPEGL